MARAAALLGVKVSAVATSGYAEYPDDLALTQLPALAIAPSKRVLDQALLPMGGFAAGSLLGAALFHLLPEAVAGFDEGRSAFLRVLLGFTIVIVLIALSILTMFA